MASIVSLALLGCTGRMGGPGTSHHDADASDLADADDTRIPDADADRPAYDDAGPDAETPADATDERRPAARELVDGLVLDSYTDSLRQLSGFGDRSDGSQSYQNAETWLEGQLAGAGYTVDRHTFSRSGAERASLYVTKVGETAPDQMYIVSAHLDGTGGGGGADDDASGVSLVLEAARAFARADVATDSSIRFVFWAAEETGLDGSAAYAEDRAGLQGLESPPGSGAFPEPTWLGVIQHDMLLFDHGLPPGPDQAPGADIDVEFNASCAFADAGRALASALVERAGSFALAYPAELGDEMTNTDSTSFMDRTASVSVRENRRLDEIGRGSNPHWHQPTDAIETYGDADLRLGFAALQMTVATTAELAGAWIEP